MTGHFITVEGIDGAGKTTVVEALEEEFEDVHRTAEPSELWTGKQVRRAIANDGDADPLTTFYLFMADRVHHIENEVKPAVEDGQIVVSDRYADSTRVYQPLALADHVENPESFIRDTMKPWDYEPDLTLYIDLQPGIAIGRVEGSEKYEKIDFIEDVKENYEELYSGREHAHRVVRIDGDQTKEEVAQDAVDAVEAHINGNN
jgi:dTMP kinase